MKDLFGDPVDDGKGKAKRRDRSGRKRVDFKVPTPYRPTPCRSCSAPIVFVRIPGQTKPHPCHVESKQVRAGSVFMESHYAHCPQAKQWREQGGRRACRGPKCQAKVPDVSPFCRECWAKLTVGIRTAIRDRFRADRARGGQPSRAYLEAIKLAQIHLEREG